MPHLLVDISAHGYGHLGQTGPVLNALAQALPGLEFTVRSQLPRERLARRIAVPFRHCHAASDFGYVMTSAIDLDLPATAQRYRDFHRDWAAKVAADAAWMKTQAIDAVLSNVAYLPLAAAASVGIPAVAMCSLNWADLCADNFATDAWAQPVIREMRDAYGAAQAFLRVSPGMPMAGFAKRRIIGPICALAAADRQAMARRLGIDAAEQWLLIAMGGIDFSIDLARWPSVAGLRYLVPPALACPRRDVTVFDSTQIDFTALLATADVVLTKPGYGTFVEAACHGRPVLYVVRGNWAEEIFLTEWLHAHTQALAIDRAVLVHGELAPLLEAVCAQPLCPPAAPTGIAQAVAAIAAIIAER